MSFFTFLFVILPTSVLFSHRLSIYTTLFSILLTLGHIYFFICYSTYFCTLKPLEIAILFSLALFYLVLTNLHTIVLLYPLCSILLFYVLIYPLICYSVHVSHIYSFISYSPYFGALLPFYSLFYSLLLSSTLLFVILLTSGLFNPLVCYIASFCAFLHCF